MLLRLDMGIFIRIFQSQSFDVTKNNGVPQGSVLNPLLVNIYPNDPIKCIKYYQRSCNCWWMLVDKICWQVTWETKCLLNYDVTLTEYTTSEYLQYLNGNY